MSLDGASNDNCVTCKQPVRPRQEGLNVMGVKSGTTEPAKLVCNCYHLFIYVYGLTNLLMFILTFDQDFHFAVIQPYKG